MSLRSLGGIECFTATGIWFGGEAGSGSDLQWRPWNLVASRSVSDSVRLGLSWDDGY